MKKIMINYKAIAICLFTIFTLGFTKAVLAGNNPGTPVELKFIGTHHNKAVFRLELNNSSDGEYTVTIRDGDKVLLLSEKLKGKNITRKYQADTEEISMVDGTTFEITNMATKETSVYKIRYKTSFVENTVITKL